MRTNDPTHRLYFAYGSNMDPYQMTHERCSGAEAVGVGKLDGFRFVINDRGVATIAESGGCVVYGVVWSITPEHEEILDRFEGVHDDWYVKREVEVRMESGETISALVYIDPNSAPGDPRACYMGKILRGAWHFGLPEAYFAELKTWDN